MNLDQKQPGFPEHVLPDYLESIGVPYHDPRAGHLFGGHARGAGRQDDVLAVLAPAPRRAVRVCRKPRASPRSRSATIATTWSRRSSSTCSSTPSSAACRPSCVSDDGRHVVIRPLAYVREDDIADVCASRSSSRSSRATCAARRKTCSASRCKRMMDAVGDAKRPGASRQIARALGDMRPSQLSDPKLFDFLALGRARRCAAAGCACVVGGRSRDDATTLRPDDRSRATSTPYTAFSTVPAFPPSRE